MPEVRGAPPARCPAGSASRPASTNSDRRASSRTTRPRERSPVPGSERRPAATVDGRLGRNLLRRVTGRDPTDGILFSGQRAIWRPAAATRVRGDVARPAARPAASSSTDPRHRAIRARAPPGGPARKDPHRDGPRLAALRESADPVAAPEPAKQPVAEAESVVREPRRPRSSRTVAGSRPSPRGVVLPQRSAKPRTAHVTSPPPWHRRDSARPAGDLG